MAIFLLWAPADQSELLPSRSIEGKSQALFSRGLAPGRKRYRLLTISAQSDRLGKNRQKSGGRIRRELAVNYSTRPCQEQLALFFNDPRVQLTETVTYLSNNQERMDFPSYRCRGLPVRSCAVESLIKEFNRRVKGTEKFWNRPAGAEAILQVRAALLSDGDRLSRFIHTRPGQLHYRRTIPTSPVAPNRRRTRK